MITKKENKEVKKFSTLMAVFFGVVFIFIGLQRFPSVEVSPEKYTASVTHVFKEELRAPQDPFQNIAIEARAAYVLDLATGDVLFARNENEKAPLASVTKLMTAYVAREYMSPNTLVTITKDDLAVEGNSGLRSGEQWLLSNLIDVMLLVSSNDAAHAIASVVGLSGQDVESPAPRKYFVQMMNKKAKVLGFSTMEFFNESGLDVSNVRNGGYGSAREVALLMAELWTKYPETLEITARKNASIYSQDSIVHILQNTNKVIGHFPGLLGSKTGYTNIAGGNLVIIFDRGIDSPVVVVVLGSTYKERFNDMQKLVGVTVKAVK